jgi:hypothetical protein
MALPVLLLWRLRAHVDLGTAGDDPVYFHFGR